MMMRTPDDPDDAIRPTQQNNHGMSERERKAKERVSWKVKTCVPEFSSSFFLLHKIMDTKRKLKLFTHI